MKIQVLCHSSIKVISNNIIYIDPYRIKETTHDADYIFITHSHYDHFSEEDIQKVKKENTKILVTTDLLQRTIELGFHLENITVVQPNQSYQIKNLSLKTIPAYNINKQFHPQENGWIGYLVKIENQVVYIAGDTDITEENKKINCDIALVPIGGTYTMNYIEAADLVNAIKPKVVIPMHYGEIVGKKEDAIAFRKLIDKSIEVVIQI